MEETLTLSKDNLSILLHTPSSPSSRQTRDCEPQSHLSYRQLSWEKRNSLVQRIWRKSNFPLDALDQLLVVLQQVVHLLLLPLLHVFQEFPDHRFNVCLSRQESESWVICCSCSIDLSKEKRKIACFHRRACSSFHECPWLAQTIPGFWHVPLSPCNRIEIEKQSEINYSRLRVK